MKILLSTDEVGAASGFSAGYQFLPTLTNLGGKLNICDRMSATSHRASSDHRWWSIDASLD